MNVLVIDELDDATAWSAVQPDGVTASTDVTLTMVSASAATGAGPDEETPAWALITASGGARGHALRRTLDPVDLTGFTRLRISVRPLRAGQVPSRLLLELRLGSAAQPVQDSTDTWHRLVPVEASGSWQRVEFSLDDLPTEVASAVTELRLRCLTGPFALHVADLAATEATGMLLECDAALVAAFGTVNVGDRDVALTIGPRPEADTVVPRIDARNIDARYAPHREVEVPGRCDYTTLGFRESTAGTPYDVDYAITPVAETRAEQAVLLDAVLDRLPPCGELRTDGDRYPIELLTLPGADRADGAGAVIGEVPVLVYRIGARTPTRVGPPVHEVQEIHLSTDLVVTA